MARITVEDCIDKFPSRFELVLVASNRARKLHSGENPTLDKDNDKNTVIALREIAEETLTINDLKDDLIEEYQTASLDQDEELDLVEDREESIDDQDTNLILKNDEKLSEESEAKDNTGEVNLNDETINEVDASLENSSDTVIQEDVNDNLIEDETDNQ
tara:strand:+ start:1414 stop:1890 length:477 start_codon:yes stop_codon:yes gene_type:complete